MLGKFLIRTIIAFMVLIIGIAYLKYGDYYLECKRRNIENCSGINMECYDDCLKLGKEYFKYDSGGCTGGVECYCLDGNSTLMIW